MSSQLESLCRQAQQLKAESRLEEALLIYRIAADRFPDSGVALHNLAAMLGDLAQHLEASQVAVRALRTGLDAPETWLVLARAALGCGDLSAAHKAYEQVLRRQPGSLPGHYEAAQLVWMTTGDRAKSLVALEAAIRSPGSDPLLRMVKAQVLEFVADAPTALSSLMALAARTDCPAQVLAYAAHLSAESGDLELAIGLSERGVRLAPADPGALEALARARLAAGDAAGAEAILEPLSRQIPNNQHVLALLAVAWRIKGDSRYRALYNYAQFVQARPLSVPRGWNDLPSYVRSLVAELKQAHLFRTHPFGHSLRHGSQLPDVLRRSSPAIAAFGEALSGPLAAYLTTIGTGDSPLTRRNSGRASVNGSWSVWLRPGGHHVDHVHQHGWVSSACHLELPEAVGAGGREGWLRFGQPGLSLLEPLAAEHWIQPEPGLVTLFPSYMWHGTEAFGGEQSRLTLAFDLVPA